VVSSVVAPEPTYETAPPATAEPSAPVGPVALPAPSGSPWPPSTGQARSAVFDVPILTYHVIAPWDVARAYARPNLAIDPTLFDAQLKALHAAGWRTVTAAALADALALGAPPPPRTFVVTIDDGHSDGFTYALPILEHYGFVATFYVVAGRVGEPDNLSWTQIRSLIAAGMEIGNHTLGHRALAQLSAADVQTQVEGAQARFIAALGVAPTTFAYPFGSFDAAVVAAIELAGFRMAVTTARGAAESWNRRLEVPRIEIGPSFPPAEVLAKIAGFR
jgi:peptidoglycan/xylan/chitin deacetylase (PgdA/CDA1 family)